MAISATHPLAGWPSCMDPFLPCSQKREFTDSQSQVRALDGLRRLREVRECTKANPSVTRVALVQLYVAELRN